LLSFDAVETKLDYFAFTAYVRKELLVVKLKSRRSNVVLLMHEEVVKRAPRQKLGAD
jgi:hypothetical protein